MMRAMAFGMNSLAIIIFRLLPPSEEQRPIGKWGRMHREYLREHCPILFNDLILSGQLWTYLADLNGQAQECLSLIVEQMKISEGVTEELKAADQMIWGRAIVLQIEIRNVDSDLFSIIRITLKSFQRIRKQSVTCTVNGWL